MRYLYIGTYTQHESQGIYICRFDPATGAIEVAGTAKDHLNPSFLTLDPTGRHLYAANEMVDGAVASYAVDPETGALTLMGRQASRGSSSEDGASLAPQEVEPRRGKAAEDRTPPAGAHPCHVSIAGDSLLVTNYTGGSVAALPILPGGALGPASSFVQHEGAGPTERQTGPHPHSALHVGGFVYVPDLGLDRVVIYRLAASELVPHEFAQLAPGSGPRHLAATPDGGTLYLANELNSTVTVLRREAETGLLEAMQTLPTLPPDYTGINYPADLHLHPSGRFLYLSNREHDSIALFTVDAESSLLTPAGHFPTGGRWCRSFAIDPSGRFLMAAHQKSDSVVSLAIDQTTGALRPTGHSVPIPVPVSVCFA